MTTVTRPIHFAFKGRRKRAVAVPPHDTATEGGNANGAAHGGVGVASGRVPRIARLMALAIRFDGLLRKGLVPNQSELAHLARVTQPRMTQIMNLLNLAPDIQEKILHLPEVTAGRDPMTERELRAIAALHSWLEQRQAWMLLPTARSLHP